MGTKSVLRTLLHVFCIIITLGAAIMAIAASCRAGWMSAEHNGMIHRHGLFVDCQRNFEGGKMFCSIIEHDKEDVSGEREHEHGISKYEHITMATMFIGVACALAAVAMALITLCGTCCHRRKCATICGSLWVSLLFIAACLITVGLCVFAYQAGLESQQFLYIGSAKAQQKLGSDFYLAVYAGVFMWVALLCSGGTVGWIIASTLYGKGGYPSPTPV